nr:alcohol dehydrogenase catalytic domain-containing protein [Streptomyces albus]
MRAARITGLGRTDLATVPVPGPEPGSVLVRTRKVGICGTDLEILHGTSAFLQDGRITFPHVFGHEWYGEVVAYAEEPPADAPGVGTLVVGRTMVPCGRCADCHAGRTQSCAALREVGLYGLQGGAADYVRVPAHALTPLPASLPEPAGALVEPAVSVVEAFERARLRFDDRVAVVGTGTMGLLAVQFARHHAAAVDAVGIDGGRARPRAALRRGRGPPRRRRARARLLPRRGGVGRRLGVHRGAPHGTARRPGGTGGGRQGAGLLRPGRTLPPGRGRTRHPARRLPLRPHGRPLRTGRPGRGAAGGRGVPGRLGECGLRLAGAGQKRPAEDPPGLRRVTASGGRGRSVR